MNHTLKQKLPIIAKILLAVLWTVMLGWIMIKQQIIYQQNEILLLRQEVQEWKEKVAALDAKYESERKTSYITR